MLICILLESWAFPWRLAAMGVAGLMEPHLVLTILET